MSINVIAHNLVAMNAQRSLNISTGNKAKSAEKLSSGYRINRAADDAAGLAISEKMRRMIRGLNQGTENAKDGVSWVQIGDGALDEAHAILHRMTQLTVKSLNGTWTESDRHIMQAEFEQLQSEIDRLTDEATFNEKHIFAEHDIPFYQFEGNINWLPNQKHVITDGSNDLSITYRMTENSAPQTASITVPAGMYTTQELIDEIDTALENAGLRKQGLILEYTSSGTCNLNLEGGVHIDEARGGLAYLLYDVYEGGSTGALIGTTLFRDDYKTLPIRAGINDHMSFDIESLDGTTTHKELTIPPGSYTRPELIEWLNEELKDTSVEAVKYGNGIKLTSDDSIITALKGNMFKVDNPDKNETVSTSVFYDNIGYEKVYMIPASLIGGGVLTKDYMDEEHSYFHIDASNNTLLVQPNGSSSVTKIEIQEKDYTAEEMITTLNTLFGDVGLVVVEEPYTDKDNYTGLIIKSTVAGVDSDVGIDPKSSAYNTLFVTRAYNKLEEAEDYKRDEKKDENAYYLGGKTFSTSAMPFRVDAGVNDKFMLSVDGKSYEIALKAGAYNTTDDITKQINSVIQNMADSLPESQEKTALKSVTAYMNGNKVMLIAGSNVTRVEASAYVDNAGKVNEGYADIFTTDVTYSMATASSVNGVVELNTPVSVPISINSINQKLYVYLNGQPYKVNIPIGDYNTYDEILKEINSNNGFLLEEETEQVPIVFNTVNVSGSNNIIKWEDEGLTKLPSEPKNYESRGSSNLNQGEVGDITDNKAAQVKIDLSNNGPYNITDQNNKLQIEINGIQKTITLTNGQYADEKALAGMLQTVLNDTNTGFGTGLRGVDVSYSTKKLILTTRLKDASGKEQAGDNTNIKCSTATSTFLFDMNTKREAASVTLNKLKSEIKIQKDVNDTFNFTYKEKNGVEKTVSIKLDPATYSRSGLCDEINKKLEAQGIGVKASLDVYSLRLTATVPGEGYKIGFDSSDGKAGNSLQAIFQNADTKQQPATATINADIQDSFEIDGNSNTFKLSVNNKAYTVTLDTGKYDRDKLVDQLNAKLAAAGAGVTAKLDGKQLVLTTTAVGTGARIYMTYNGGGSAMEKIFGMDKSYHSGIKAEMSDDNKLKLTAVDKDGNVSEETKKQNIVVYSTYGSVFQTAQKSNPQTKPGTAYEGYHSTIYSYIDGAELREPTVKINQWNKDLKFSYNNGTSSKTISITLDEKEYSFAELENALQEKLDNAAGTNTLKVEVTSAGVKIIAGKPGRPYYMIEGSFSGGFYYNVLRRTPEARVDTKTQLISGGYEGAVYAVGRKDIRNNITEITKDINDTFSLDFTYGNQTHKLSMMLDAGKYDGASLVKHIQKKLNEQLEDIGLEANTIVAQIGGINTGVTGNNDKNALVFKLSNNVKLPAAGVEYKIDGIGGKAAFSVFYQTDGDMKIAYVTGTKDISSGVTIPKESSLSFDVDGNTYTLTIPAGKYSAERILDRLNTQLKDAGAPVTAKISDGYLQFVHTKYGKHPITNISGSAQKYLFFQENGATQGEKDIWIRVGSESGDGVVIDRPAMNTVSLGINSVVITKPKYAEKALKRIKSAVTSVSDVRTMFGVMQNRLEHTINKNENTSENTQAAESAIRDADISNEVLQMSKANILENVGVAMLAQANRSRQDVLNLLQ